jgi:Ser-Thr-rich glycosyl-phosphatidyl-inositol-anchored membrane family
MRYFLAFIFLVVFMQSVAQKIEIDWIEVSGNKVIVHYNLEDSNPNHQYLVNLFSSQDNFTTALAKVTGDVGQEVRGRVFVPYVKLTPFADNKVFKRGKNVQLTWVSGSTGGQVNIELFRGQQRYQVENNVPNSGRYDWHIPAGQKKGSDYKLRFTNSKDRNDFVETKVFTIKPKVPAALKVAGFVVVGAVIYFILPNGSTTTTPTPQDEPLAGNPGKPN